MASDNNITFRDQVASWDSKRGGILESLAGAIASHATSREWVAVPDIRPSDVDGRALTAAMFKEKGWDAVEGTGTRKCNLLTNGRVMLLHKFGNKPYLLATKAKPGRKYSNDKLRETVCTLTKGKRNEPEKELVGLIKDKFSRSSRDVLMDLCSKGKQAREANTSKDTTPTGQTTRRSQLLAGVKSARTPQEAAKAVAAAKTARERNELIYALAAEAKEADTLRTKLENMHTVPDAIGLLKIFREDLSDSFVASVVDRPEVEATGKIFPRKKELDDMSTRNQQNLSNVMSALALKIAQILLPDDETGGQAKLLESMLENKKYRSFALPNVDEDDRGYDLFTKSPAVKAIKNAVAKLGRSDPRRKIELVSILDGYPDAWVKKFVGVGKQSVRDAGDHAAFVGAGMRDERRPEIVRNRRRGPMEEFFVTWMKDNTTHMPLINKDSKGAYIQESKVVRSLNSNQGYYSYEAAAEKAGFPSYCKSHFYKRGKEMGIEDESLLKGVCPHCEKYGYEMWEKLEAVVKDLYSRLDESRTKNIKEIDQFRRYFVRGGPFYVSLSRESKCVHHCLQHNLSDLDDDDFMSTCEHEHTHGDSMIEDVAEFFCSLRQRRADLASAMEFKGTAENKRCVVKYVRFGIATVRYDDEMTEEVRWNAMDLPVEQMNVLQLQDHIDIIEDHFCRYLCHLCSDRNQQHGENEILHTKLDTMTMDYMMKLRPEIKREGTNAFHMLNMIGTSCHCGCYDQKLTEERLTEELKAKGASVGDSLQKHVVAFGSNTAQGGYETLCTVEATLKRLKEMHPDELVEIHLISDAGSGYKSCQNIAGLRNAKQSTGVIVRFLHFNEAGEGKRPRTDGKMTAIKAWRKLAMIAGKPSACTTARREVLAQQFKGGMEGVISLLIDFDYSNEMEVGQWNNIASYLDFKLLDDGSIRVWRYYDIGPGKIISKESIDRLYKESSSRAKAALAAAEAATDVNAPTGTSVAASAVTMDERSDESSEEEEEEEEEHVTEIRIAKYWGKRHKKLFLGSVVGPIVEDGKTRVKYDDGDDGKYDEMTKAQLITAMELYLSFKDSPTSASTEEALEGIQTSSKSSADTATRPRASKDCSRYVGPESRVRLSTFPQPPTGAKLVSVSERDVDEEGDVVVEADKVKIDPSKKKKKEAKAAVAARRVERKRKRAEAEAKEDDRRKKIMDERYPHKCPTCGKRLKRLTGHACAENATVVAGDSADSAGRLDGKLQANEAIVPTQLPREFVNDKIVLLTSRSFREVLMGNGIRPARESTYIDPAAIVILEKQYQMGVINPSDRRGALDMEEACISAGLPKYLCPDKFTCSAWLTTRLQKEKKYGKDADPFSRRRAVHKNVKRQLKAQTLSQPHEREKDNNAPHIRMRFNKKYKGVVLLYKFTDTDDEEKEEVRIVTDMKYCDEEECWYAETDTARQSDEDDRIWTADGSDDIEPVFVGRGNYRLSKCIKAWNDEYLVGEEADSDVED